MLFGLVKWYYLKLHIELKELNYLYFLIPMSFKTLNNSFHFD